MKFVEEYSKTEWLYKAENGIQATVEELEESTKILATCDYEKGTQWGKEVSLSL